MIEFLASSLYVHRTQLTIGERNMNVEECMLSFVRRLSIFAILFGLLVCTPSLVLAQKNVKPRDRFTITKNECPKKAGLIQRSFVFDSVYSITPGSSILWLHNLQQEEDASYLLEYKDLTYLGRSAEHIIKILVKDSFVVSGYVLTDEEKTVEVYIDNPDTLSVVGVGGTAEEPAFELHVTLQGSNLYYKVVGDGICPAKH
jgi:hypothetical protein